MSEEPPFEPITIGKPGRKRKAGDVAEFWYRAKRYMRNPKGIGLGGAYRDLRNFYRKAPIPRLSFWYTDWLEPFAHELFFEGPGWNEGWDLTYKIPMHVGKSLFNLATNISTDFGIGDVNFLTPSYLLPIFGDNDLEKNPVKKGYVYTWTFVGTVGGLLFSGFNPAGAWAGGQIGGLIAEATWWLGDEAWKFASDGRDEKNSLASWLGFGDNEQAIWDKMWKQAQEPDTGFTPVVLKGNAEVGSWQDLAGDLAQGFTSSPLGGGN